MSSVTPLIQVNNLTVDFWNQNHWVNVVNQVSFAMQPGEAIGLVGESGCGKTTTAYTLLGYRRPNSRISNGTILFHGRDLLHLSSTELQRVRGKQISLVPQNPTTALTPGIRVGDQLIEAMQVHGVGRDNTARQTRAIELLSDMQLPEPEQAASKYPHQLSGGQQQRVTIAMALACEPELLVLDEPTTALDVTTQAQILELLVRLRQEHGMAMMYVTHNLGVLAKIADRINVMYAGDLVEEAATMDLFRRPRHPYTRGLIASVPSLREPEHGQHLLRGFLQRENLPRGCRFAPRCEFAESINYEEPQVLREIAPGHRAACRRAVEIPTLVKMQASAPAFRQIEPPSQSEPLLSIKEIDLAYEFVRHGVLSPREPKLVVQNVSFDIKSRETFALVGESGSGKSTIARAVAGLIPPVHGTMQFEGKDISVPAQLRNRNLQRQLQLVFQNPDASLNPRQRVEEIIGRPLEFYFRLEGTAKQKRIEQLLADISLDKAYANHFPDQLSGGERQRVAIARALAANPTLMLCDEILSALDVSVQANILDLLRKLQAEHHIAYLFISHDLAVVRSLAHRVGVLYRGELVEVGTVAQVYSPPYHPYTAMLLSAVPEIDIQSEHLIAGRLDPNERRTVQHTACPFADRCPLKIGKICDEVPPLWHVLSEGHALRCHLSLEELQQRSPVLQPLMATPEKIPEQNL